MADRVLLVVRHAKAVADAATDAQRPLAGRGHRDAAAAGRWLAELGIAPDLAVVSPATRAQETWSGIAAALGGHDRTTDARLYENTVVDLLAVIGDVDDHVETLAIVGHNPSTHGLAVRLDDGSGSAEASAAIRSDYPTCGIAVFDVTTGWRDLESASATLRAFEAPRG